MTASHISSSSPQSRRACAGVSRSPGISRKSARTAGRSSQSPCLPRSPKQFAAHLDSCCFGAPRFEGEHLRVEASDGLGDGTRPVRYQIGEGKTGTVVQTARPVVVPRVSREPAFLHRAARRPELAHQELSFVCVPIVLTRRAIGGLAIDLRYKPERNFERSQKFLASSPP
jgi:signal transduction protein with GAF and PtsI domain